MTGEQFKAARKALRLTQFQTAQALNLGQYGRRAIFRWEKGTSKVPGPAEYAIRRMMDDAGVVV